MWEAKKGRPGCDLWRENHICNINHTKSSEAMGSPSAIDMFNSYSTNNLIYHAYVGNDYTYLFKNLKDSKPSSIYDFTPSRFECLSYI